VDTTECDWTIVKTRTFDGRFNSRQMTLRIFGLFFSIAVLSGCLPKAGCTDLTAENYDPEAERNDGSCIEARPKLIGDYRYTRIWDNDGTDSIVKGTARFSESGVANNTFVLNLDNLFILSGVIRAFDIIMNPYSKEETFQGFTFTRTFSGSGEFLTGDSVDVYLSLTTKVPLVDGEPPALTESVQVHQYYFTKQ
jgi:hypothetical protein